MRDIEKFTARVKSLSQYWQISNSDLPDEEVDVDSDLAKCVSIGSTYFVSGKVSDPDMDIVNKTWVNLYENEPDFAYQLGLPIPE